MSDTKIKDIIKKLSFDHHLSVNEMATFLEVDVSLINRYLEIIKNDEVSNMLDKPFEEVFENKKNM